MRAILPALILFGCASLTTAEESTDPFAVVEPKPVDRSTDQKSDKFISDTLLKAFGEKRLDMGTGKDSAVIRITILRSFHAPLIFKWSPAAPGQESFLHVKRLKWAVNDKGERTYQGLDLNQKLKLRPSQERLLKNIYSHAPLHRLPQADWTPPALDGSQWIYEAAGEDSSILISRRNPIGPLLEGAKIKAERLSHELQLTTFTMMLWALSGIDEEPY